MFANNTGFMWENAKQFKAMVLFAEHRYYGESIPYGKLTRVYNFIFLINIQIIRKFLFSEFDSIGIFNDRTGFG